MLYRYLLPLCVVGVVSGCSYYGTNHVLKPDSSQTAIGCGEVSVRPSSMLLKVDKKFYAFAGIPYFPSIFDSDSSVNHDLTIYYSNFGTREICTTSDIELTDLENNKIHYPQSTWKSKEVNSEGENHVSCNYRFDNLGDSASFKMEIRKVFLRCEMPSLPYSRISESGYHMVLIQ